MDCIRDCVRRVGKFTKLCHYMLVLDERSLYFSLTPENDLGLVKSLKVGRSVPDLPSCLDCDREARVELRVVPVHLGQGKNLLSENTMVMLLSELNNLTGISSARPGEKNRSRHTWSILLFKLSSALFYTLFGVMGPTAFLLVG
jgi:hypothetical protein